VGDGGSRGPPAARGHQVPRGTWCPRAPGAPGHLVPPGTWCPRAPGASGCRRHPPTPRAAPGTAGRRLPARMPAPKQSVPPVGDAATVVAATTKAPTIFAPSRVVTTAATRGRTDGCGGRTADDGLADGRPGRDGGCPETATGWSEGAAQTG